MFLKDEPAFGEPLNRVTSRCGGGVAKQEGGQLVTGESNPIPQHTEGLLPLPQLQTDRLEISADRWPASEAVTASGSGWSYCARPQIVEADRTKPNKSPFFPSTLHFGCNFVDLKGPVCNIRRFGEGGRVMESLKGLVLSRSS